MSDASNPSAADFTALVAQAESQLTTVQADAATVQTAQVAVSAAQATLATAANTFTADNTALAATRDQLVAEVNARYTFSAQAPVAAG